MHANSQTHTIPQVSRKAGVRRIAFLVSTFADIRHTALGHNVAPVKHQVEPVVHCLYGDKKDRHRRAIDAECHCGWGEGLRNKHMYTHTHTHTHRGK